MSLFKTRLIAPVVALLLFSAAQVRADNIGWTYSVTPAAPNLFGDSGTSGGFIAFSPASNAGANTSNIVVANISTVSGASPSLPDQFVTTGFYTLAITITDTASGQSDTKFFGGKLSGTFSDGNSNITNKFTGDITQQYFLGNNVYTVTIGGIEGNSGYTPPGPPPSADNPTPPPGSIGAHVDVSPGVVVTKDAPEPSSMVLSLFGLSTLGAGWWRKRRG